MGAWDAAMDVDMDMLLEVVDCLFEDEEDKEEAAKVASGGEALVVPLPPLLQPKVSGLDWTEASELSLKGEDDIVSVASAASVASSTDTPSSPSAASWAHDDWEGPSTPRSWASESECAPSPRSTTSSPARKRHPALLQRKRSASDAELEPVVPRSRSVGLKRRAGSWSATEDKALVQAVEQLGCRSWKRIAESVPGRTHWQCSQRWQKVLQPGLIKGPWTPAEDAVLVEQVSAFLRSNPAIDSTTSVSSRVSWTQVAAYIPGRTAKQCRERYTLSLDPSISREPWSAEEDRCILDMHASIGNQWARIREYLPRRTENQIKSRHKTLLQASKRDKLTRWTPRLERRLAELAERYDGDLSRIRRHLPKELKGSSPEALRERCSLIL